MCTTSNSATVTVAALDGIAYVVVLTVLSECFAATVAAILTSIRFLRISESACLVGRG